MQEEFTHVLASATTSGDVSKISAIATDWAAEHPIRQSISDRPSWLTRIFEREFSETMSAGQAIGEAISSLDDLNRKIEVYSDQLLRQARWEAESHKMQLLGELRADEAIPLAERAVTSAAQAVAAVDHLASSLEGALKVAEDVPRLMASERKAAVQVVHEELKRTNEFIRQERITALDQLTQERVLALEELNETFAQVRQQAKRAGILDVAAQILAKAKEPMGCVEIVERALKAKMWTTGGKTPHATLYAAMTREIAKKGKDARCEKVERGLFKARKLT